MPDRAIVVPDTAAAPKDYEVSGAQEIALKSVRAIIDGSGAGSTFLPTLQLLDPNGHVMWEGATSATVAAGGSADVSWFPGLGGRGGSTSASVALAWASGGPQSVTTGTEAFAGFGATHVSDPAVFTWSTTTLPNDTLTIGPQGAAICIASALINVGLANFNIFVDGASGGIFSHTGWLTPQAFLNPPPEGFSSIMDTAWLDLQATNTEVKLGLANGNGFDTGPVSYRMAVMFFAGAETI